MDFLRPVALLGWDNLLKGAAFKSEPAVYLDPLPSSGSVRGRALRVAVILGAIMAIGLAPAQSL